MNPFEKLNGKKGLLAIALLMAVVMALPFAANYYTYTLSYNIIPLTASFNIPITATSGATKGSYGPIVKDYWINVTKALDKIGFGVHAWVDADSDNTADVKEAYYTLNVTIEVASTDGVPNFYDDTREIGNVTLSLINRDTLASLPYELFIDPASPIATGSYDVRITITYWTGNVSSIISSTQPIDVWGVE